MSSAGKPSKNGSTGRNAPPVEARLAPRTLDRLRGRAVLRGRMLEQTRRGGAQLRGEHRRDGPLQRKPLAVASGHQRAEVVAVDEPARDFAARHDARHAGGALDQRRLPQHVAGGEARDAERAAAGQRDQRFHFTGAQHKGAARRLALAQQALAPAKLDRTGYRKQLFVQ